MVGGRIAVMMRRRVWSAFVARGRAGRGDERVATAALTPPTSTSWGGASGRRSTRWSGPGGSDLGRQGRTAGQGARRRRDRGGESATGPIDVRNGTTDAEPILSMMRSGPPCFYWTSLVRSENIAMFIVK